MTFTLASHRLLVVCAHPDDESFGLGAVIAAFTAAGTPTRVLCFTQGEASTLGAAPGLPARRVREMRAAAGVLDVSDLLLLDYPDGALSEVPDAVLGQHLDDMVVDADLILTFDAGGITGHPDHRAATRAAINAGRRHDIAVLGWTIPDDIAAQLSAEYPATFVGTPRTDSDLVLVVDRAKQRAAMAEHASQMENNTVPLRRLKLQGDLEHLIYLHRPAGSNRPIAHIDPAVIDTTAHAPAAHRVEQVAPFID